MGRFSILARCLTGIPILVFAAILFSGTACAQDPKQLLEEADRLLSLSNWLKAGPLFVEAEKLFTEAGDQTAPFTPRWAKFKPKWIRDHSLSSLPISLSYCKTQSFKMIRS